MKTKYFLIAALTLGLVFTSCSDDDKDVSVEKVYHMYLGLGHDSYTGTEAPAITSLQSSVETAVAEINTGFGDFTVTGKGSDETAALADAQQKAIAVYDERAEAVIVKMINIKANFELSRESLAAEILEETGYRTKLTMKLYLLETTGEIQDPTIKESETYYMEAIGGEDYSDDE